MNRQDAKDAKREKRETIFFPAFLGVLGVLAVQFRLLRGGAIALRFVEQHDRDTVLDAKDAAARAVRADQFLPFQP
jgi:hypothetical protein